MKIAVTSLYDEVHRLCADYRIPGPAADFSVKISRSDIDYERMKSAREDEIEGIPIRQFSDGYLETLAVYRRIAEKMPEYRTLLFHGSCVAVDGAGYLFTAKSGTGKSTHTRLWREMLGNRAAMAKTLQWIDRLAASVPLWRPGCNMEPEAARIAYEAMKG